MGNLNTRSAFLARPLVLSHRRSFRALGHENEEWSDLDFMLTQIIQVGVLCVVPHFIPDSFTAEKATTGIDGG